MATSIKIKFRPSGRDSQEGTICYRLIHKRDVRVINTSYKVFESELNQKSKSVIFSESISPDRVRILTSIQSRVAWDVKRLRRIIAELEMSLVEYSTSDIVSEYRRITAQGSLQHYLIDIALHLESLGQVRTAETYISALHSFQHFINGEDIPLEGITPRLMQQYEAWLKRRGICINTISFYMRRLRAAYNQAVEQGLTIQSYPFRHVFTGCDKTAKRALPITEIRRIKQLDLSNCPSLEFARDMFMFSFFTRGMSFIDMAWLKKNDLQSGFLVYHRHKTGQRLSIKWEKCMDEIAKKYSSPTSDFLLPIIITKGNERKQYKQMQFHINYCLKQISHLAQISTSLTMYVARHSWASIANAKHIPISVISEGMGHDSEKTTRIYLASLDASVVDKANKMILKDI